MRSNNTQKRNAPWLVRSIVAALAVLALMSSCINPFQTDYSRSEGASPSSSGLQMGSIVINPENSLQAQTIMPELDTLDGLAARRVISFTNITPGGLTRDPVDPWNGADPIADIPYGTWTISYEAFNAADDLIATGQAENVVINAASTPVLIDIVPLTAGNGTLDYTITFPPEAVTDVSVELEAWSDGALIIFTAGNEFNADYADTGSLEILEIIPSGAYRLRIQFSDSTATGDGMHAPIVKIAQIYDGLVSSATTNITLAELRSPPDAPSNIIVEFTAENTFNVYWTDNSNTEQGFRMYQDDGFGNRQPLGTQLPSGTESVTGLSSAFTPPVDDFTLEVVAFNQFGESDPLSFTFRLLEAAQFPNFQNTANTNSPLWAAAGNPGNINWSTMIVGGGGDIRLYLSAGDISNPVSLPPPIPQGAPPYELSEVGPFSPGTTYNWRIENVGDIGNEGRVIYPVQEFTVRDGVLYVSTPTNTPAGAANAAGSAAAPISTIAEAVTIAQPGEVIRVAVGSYTGAVTMSGDNDKSLTLEGGYSEDFASRVPAADIATLNPGVNVTTISSVLQVFNHTSTTGNSVIIDGFHIRGGDSAVEFGGNSVATLTGSVLENGGGNLANATGFLTNVRVATSGSVSILDNSFDMAPLGLANAANITSEPIFASVSGDQVRVEGNSFYASMQIRDYTAVRGNPSLDRTYEVISNSIEPVVATDPGTGAALISLQSGSLIFIDNIVHMASGNGTTAVRAVRFASTGALTLSRNDFHLNGSAVTEPTVTAVDLISDSVMLSRVDNNLFHVDSYAGNFRAVQMQNNRDLNIDHNTLVVSGIAPVGWNLFNLVFGVSQVQIRNNIAQGFDNQSGRPVNTGEATTIVQHNLFFNFLDIRVGNIMGTVALLNNLASAENNVEQSAELDASFALTITSPQEAREFGIDLTGAPDNIDYDRNNNLRIAPAISMGAFQY